MIRLYVGRNFAGTDGMISIASLQKCSYQFSASFSHHFLRLGIGILDIISFFAFLKWPYASNVVNGALTALFESNSTILLNCNYFNVLSALSFSASKVRFASTWNCSQLSFCNCCRFFAINSFCLSTWFFIFASSSSSFEPLIIRSRPSCATNFVLDFHLLNLSSS